MFGISHIESLPQPILCVFMYAVQTNVHPYMLVRPVANDTMEGNQRYNIPRVGESSVAKLANFFEVLIGMAKPLSID